MLICVGITCAVIFGLKLTSKPISHSEIVETGDSNNTFPDYNASMRMSCQESATGNDVLVIHDVLPKPSIEETDIFGCPSNFTSILRLCELLLQMGVIPQNSTVVDVMSSDSKGYDDPVYPLFSQLGFSGLILRDTEDYSNVEEMDIFYENLPVMVTTIAATENNIVQLIKTWILVDDFNILKVDVKGWDCQLVNAILVHSNNSIAVVVVGFNANFPPPVKMILSTSPIQSFRKCLQGNVYGCSLQYLHDNVMIPAGYVLLQVCFHCLIGEVR